MWGRVGGIPNSEFTRAPLPSVGGSFQPLGLVVVGAGDDADETHGLGTPVLVPMADPSGVESAQITTQAKTPR